MAASYTFEDHSGMTTSADHISNNPFEVLIQQCHDDPAKIQTCYESHRSNRNAKQKSIMLAPDFTGPVIDQILVKLQDPISNPGFRDWRHCLVFWARPPSRLRHLIGQIQHRLVSQAVPNLWLMPSDDLHLTVMEVTHSRSSEEIAFLVEKLRAHVESIASCTVDHRARLVKPRLSYDAQALALSFLPASSEPMFTFNSAVTAVDDTYTYHHLRRDMYHNVHAAGLEVTSRYVIPSAHITIGRFVQSDDMENTDGTIDETKVADLVHTIEKINEWLEQHVWNTIQGEWIVGEEKGLECRQGSLWYGGGETVHIGPSI